MKDYKQFKQNCRAADWHVRRGGKFIKGPYTEMDRTRPFALVSRKSFYGSVRR